MKKIILLLVSAVIISSCTASDEIPMEYAYDCCNIVVTVSAHPLPGSDKSAIGSYVTKNNCSGALATKNYTSTAPVPKRGECY